MRTMLIVCWLCSVASASPETPSSPRGRKDPTTARNLSVASTLLAGGGLLAAGALLRDHDNSASGVAFVGCGLAILVGPSVGHIYAEDVANRWLALRVTGLGLVGVGGIAAISSALQDPPNNGGAGGGLALVGLGALGIVAGVIGDIATASSSAETYNAEHHLDIHVTPAPIVTPSGVTPGVGLVGRF